MKASRTPLAALLLLLAVALAWPAGASAGKLERRTVDGRTHYVYTGDNFRQDDIVVFRILNGTGSADDELEFSNTADSFFPRPSECVLVPPPNPNNTIECPVTGISHLTYDLGNLGDFWKTLDGVNIDSTVDGGLGDDRLDARGGEDTVRGGEGNDTIEDLSDLADSDVLDGGPGNDDIDNGDGADDIRGGAGVDTVFFGSSNDIITLDDVADDGGASGEGDNVHSDVENVGAGGGDDVVSGSASANSLNGGSGDDRLDGGAGADQLTGSTGADDLVGGSDFDRVAYPESGTPARQDQRITLDGVAGDGAAGENDNVRADVEDVSAGPGDDVIVGDAEANTLEGGPGADDITGGPGVDTLFGGEDADVLRARDGLRERVDCGGGGSATVDSNDDVVGCAPVSASSELIPDLDGDGVDRPPRGVDCDDSDPAVRPGAAEVVNNDVDENCDGRADLDRDGDGALAPPGGDDCDDANAAIRPGAREVRGNRRDENCDGVAGEFPVVGANVTLTSQFFAKAPATLLLGLRVLDLRGRETVRLKCLGRGCRRGVDRSVRVRSGKRALNLTRAVKGMRLRPGARIRVAVSRRNHVARVFTFKMTAKGKGVPKRKRQCRPPGGKRGPCT